MNKEKALKNQGLEFREDITLRWGESAKSMKKNAKLAPSQTPLRQAAIFLHNADFPHLRVTKLPPDSPAERCCFALAIDCVRENG